MEAHQNKKTMTESEKERWQLIGVIATAVGTAIAGYFAGKSRAMSKKIKVLHLHELFQIGENLYLHRGFD